MLSLSISSFSLKFFFKKIKEIKPYPIIIKPPIKNKVGLSLSCSNNWLVLKYAINIKTMSEKTIPKSKVKAALKPFVIEVSSNIKKPGPIEKVSKRPQGIAVNISW